MKKIIIAAVVFCVQSPVYARCLNRQSESEVYTLSKYGKCSTAELVAGQSKMKKVIQKTKKSKSYNGRTAEKALAELQLYNINHELAMRGAGPRAGAKRL